MSYMQRAYVTTVLAVMSISWYITRIWMPNDISTEDLIMHAIVSCSFIFFAYEAWREIIYTLSRNRICECGHLRGRHNNDQVCLQEVQDSFPINKQPKVWRRCTCQRYKHDWSVVK